MMNKDKELFELCKEVYRRTKDTWGWTDDMRWIEVNHFGEVSIFPKWRSLYNNSAEVQKHAPLYTSDYLLEKLIPNHLTLTNHWAAGGWKASYRQEGDMYNEKGTGFMLTADTPLKALLRLTIALDNAGVKL